jgi:hypothetical protein
MASGTMLAVSHFTADDTPPGVQATIHAVYAEASALAAFRTGGISRRSSSASTPDQG